MAVSLTASASLIIQGRIEEMFNAQTAAGAQYDNPVRTIRRLAESQTVRSLPIMDNANRCIDWKLWWTDLADIEADTIYSSTTPDGTADCDIKEGQDVGTQAETYEPDVYINLGFNVSDNLCANEADFLRLSTDGLNHVMLRMRRELNKRAIQWMNTHITANVDTVVSTAEYGMTVSGTTTTVTADTLNNQALFSYLEIIAESNRIPTYLIMDGTNLYASEKIAPYLGLNDNQRSFGAIYADVSSRYNYDLRDVNTVVGESATFLVNPNMFGFFNRSKYGATAQTIDWSRNMQAFSIEDPLLRYRRTTVNADGSVTTTLVPVMYDVLYVRECTGRDANGRHVFTHKWEVMFEGGMAIGPNANSGATNILKFVKESGI